MKYRVAAINFGIEEETKKENAAKETTTPKGVLSSSSNQKSVASTFQPQVEIDDEERPMTKEELLATLADDNVDPGKPAVKVVTEKKKNVDEGKIKK